MHPYSSKLRWEGTEGFSVSPKSTAVSWDHFHCFGHKMSHLCAALHLPTQAREQKDPSSQFRAISDESRTSL
uniref:Ovule protein n=1 Tax=Steinernema glaseri TaxID=37863 RepID=A0A1I7Y2J2_9BILA